MKDIAEGGINVTLPLRGSGGVLSLLTFLPPPAYAYLSQHPV